MTEDPPRRPSPDPESIVFAATLRQLEEVIGAMGVLPDVGREGLARARELVGEDTRVQLAIHRALRCIADGLVSEQRGPGDDDDLLDQMLDAFGGDDD